MDGRYPLEVMLEELRRENEAIALRKRSSWSHPARQTHVQHDQHISTGGADAHAHRQATRYYITSTTGEVVQSPKITLVVPENGHHCANDIQPTPNLTLGRRASRVLVRLDDGLLSSPERMPPLSYESRSVDRGHHRRTMTPPGTSQGRNQTSSFPPSQSQGAEIFNRPVALQGPLQGHTKSLPRNYHSVTHRGRSTNIEVLSGISSYHSISSEASSNLGTPSRYEIAVHESHSRRSRLNDAGRHSMVDAPIIHDSILSRYIGASLENKEPHAAQVLEALAAANTSREDAPRLEMQRNRSSHKPVETQADALLDGLANPVFGGKEEGMDLDGWLDSTGETFSELDSFLHSISVVPEGVPYE